MFGMVSLPLKLLAIVHELFDTASYVLEQKYENNVIPL